MSESAVDEPDPVREQVRQITRYRGLIAAGLVVGLAAGAYLALGGANTYSASSEVMVRAATTDPFAAGATPDKGIDIGTERQSAMSSTVTDSAAKATGVPARTLQKCLQVTNPPNTLVLRFSCSAGSAKNAATWVNALTSSYLDGREGQTKKTIKKMIAGYQDQLNPLVKQRSDLLSQIQASSSSQVVGTLVSVQTNLLSRINELNGSISGLRALDTTPGRRHQARPGAGRAVRPRPAADARAGRRPRPGAGPAGGLAAAGVRPAAALRRRGEPRPGRSGAGHAAPPARP